MRLIDYVNEGGSITWILVFMNIFGLSLIIWRFWFIHQYKKTLGDVAKEIISDAKNHNSSDFSNLVKDFIALKVSDLEVGLTLIKVIATISPLLGLLGTVVGLFDSFQIIAAKGLDNPGDFASGISLALITTIAGLIVAIPHTVAHNMISTQLDTIEVSLEKTILTTAGSKS